MPDDKKEPSGKAIDLNKEEIFLPNNSEKEGKVADNSNGKWLNNKDELVEEVFGFNENAELVNGRSAMIGFLMLIITEIIFNGQPVTHSIFGIG